jgi:hypothetical protein
MKKIIVMSLLAANLLYFAWSQWQSSTSPQLTAVVATAAKPKPTLVPPSPTAPAPCATLGPFTVETQAIGAKTKLETTGWGVIQREVKEPTPNGWWVYVKNTNSKDQARTLNTIHRAGISDAFAMPDDAEFRVSVGIFSEENRAEDRATKVQRLRLDALVTQRYRDDSVYWLDVPGVARETMADGRLTATGLDLSRLRVEACPIG